MERNIIYILFFFANFASPCMRTIVEERTIVQQVPGGGGGGAVETPAPTVAPTEAPTTPDPCMGCVPPPVLPRNFLAGCEPDAPGMVQVSLLRNGTMCSLQPTGCPIGYLFVFDNQLCAFTQDQTIGPNVMCINGNFYQVNPVNMQVRFLNYIVGGCSTFQF